MVRWTTSLLAMTALLLGMVACGTDEAQENLRQEVDTLTQEMNSLRSEFTDAQEQLPMAQAILISTIKDQETSLREALTTVETRLSGAQERLGTTDESAILLSASLAATQEKLAQAQASRTDLGQALSDLRDSFLTTRHDVGLNTDAIALNAQGLKAAQQDIVGLQSSQQETSQTLTLLNSEIVSVKATNQALLGKVSTATDYSKAVDAYFSYARAITQAARNTGILALRDAVSDTEDADLLAALNNWLDSVAQDAPELLNVFIDVLGTKLLLALTS